jgi:hypothetical protein
MSRIKSLLFVLALAAQVPLASATVTYVVGTCKNTPFKTITSALQATPPPNVVEVCPGFYFETIPHHEPGDLGRNTGQQPVGAASAVHF